MSTIPTNKISSDELNVQFVINNTKFIEIPISNFERKYKRSSVQNTIMNVCYYNKNVNIFATGFCITMIYQACKIFNKNKPNKIVGVWKQKAIVKPKKVVTKKVIKNNEISIIESIPEYVTKEYNPYDAPVEKLAVVIDEKLKVPIPKHPMEYNIFSNGINRFLKNKYLKKYFK